MADNLGYTAGAGTSIAADDIGSVFHQRIKIVIGADGVSDGDVSAANPLPVSLPATAATGAKQDAGNTSVASIDAKTPALGQALAAASVPVVLTAAQITTLTPPAALTGYATSALQTTGNTSLSNIDSKVPALGQALAAASVPVVLTTAQITALTPYASVGISGSVAVTGSFYQATQPVSIAATVAVSGPLTDTQLRAVAVPVSGTFWQTTQPISGTVTANAGTGTMAVSGTFWQATQPVSGTVTANAGTGTFSTREYVPVFRGRASTFRTPGRAGTAGQKILSLHNASGSAVTVSIRKVIVDLNMTVIKAVTVLPPVIRLWKVTVLPTNGTALTKNKIGGTGATNASVTVLGDASADGTGSATTLTATLPAGAILTQEFAPRLITAAGYEMADRIEFLGDTSITLAALEGVVVFLDYTLATMNPTTDMWLAGVEWDEN